MDDDEEDIENDLFDGDPIPLTQPVRIPPFPADSLPKPIAEMVHGGQRGHPNRSGDAGHLGAVSAVGLHRRARRDRDPPRLARAAEHLHRDDRRPR